MTERWNCRLRHESQAVQPCEQQWSILSVSQQTGPGCFVLSLTCVRCFTIGTHKVGTGYRAWIVGWSIGLRNFCCIWSSSVMLNGAIGLYFCVFDRGSFHVFHEYNGFWTLLWWLRVWRDISVLHLRYGMWKIKGNLFVIMYGAELALVCFPHSHLSHERGADSLHWDNPESVTG